MQRAKKTRSVVPVLVIRCRVPGGTVATSDGFVAVGGKLPFSTIPWPEMSTERSVVSMRECQRVVTPGATRGLAMDNSGSLDEFESSVM